MDSISWEDFLKLKKRDVLVKKVETNSMHPLIPAGSTIKILIGKQEIKTFDIIVFWQHDKMYCHYVCTKPSNRFPHWLQTASLGGGSKDEPIKLEQVLGLVINYRFSWWQKWWLSITRS